MNRAVTSFLSLCILFLASCGGSPPSSEANKAIADSILSSNTFAYDAGDKSAEIVGISIKGWKRNEMVEKATNGMKAFESDWSAKLRFKEPLAVILQEVEGTYVVAVVADKGAELPFSGSIHALRNGDKWEIGAMPKDLTSPWKDLEKKSGPITMGYATSSGTKFRRTSYTPVSQLGKYVVEGSPEYKKLAQELQEKFAKQQAAAQAAAEQQRRQLEERQRQQQEQLAAEQQRRVEEQQRQQEEARKQAEAQRLARLLPLVTPFKNPAGIALASDAGYPQGILLFDTEVDEAKLTVKGKAINLRELPFKEYTFDGSASDRGSITLTFSPPGQQPITFGLNNNLLATQGLTVVPLADNDRASLNTSIAAGKRLGAEASKALSPQVLDPAAVTEREKTMTPSAIQGTAIYRGRVDARVNPMFGGSLAYNTTHRWGNGESVLLRLASPVKGKHLYIRGTNAPTDNLSVIINGVHRVTIPSIPKMGSALIPLPDDLEILELRLDALGTANSRGVMLLN